MGLNRGSKSQKSQIMSPRRRRWR